MESTITELDENTYMIMEGNGPAATYMYLLIGKEKALLIDSGYGSISLNEKCKELTDKPIEVVLTHGHVDHIGGTFGFSKIYLQEEDLCIYKEHSKDNVRHLFTKEDLSPVNQSICLIKGQEEFELGNRRIQCIRTPGHTKGSICLLDRSRKWIFTGDTCCKAHVLFQVGNAATMEEYKRALEGLLSIQKEYEIMWPGHHSYPVEKDILTQFYEATSLLIDKKVEPQQVNSPFGMINVFRYKDIGIEYDVEK